MLRRSFLALSAAAALQQGCAARDKNELLHVSFDASRELLAAINNAYTASFADELKFRQSHGGSGKQTRSVMEGLQADVVSLALGFDVDALVGAKLVHETWRERLPFNASPFSSTIVFLVRGGNPKKITGFDDLVRDDVKIVTPNPKTSGGARWSYAAVWDHALRSTGNQKAAERFMQKLFANVPVLDSGARGAMSTFAKRQIGDVLLAWESEAIAAITKLSGKLEMVLPTRSIKAEIPIAVVDRVVEHRGSRRQAERYAEFFFSEEAQKLLPTFHYRAATTNAAPHGGKDDIELFRLEDEYGSWASFHADHFAEGGSFDRATEQS